MTGFQERGDYRRKIWTFARIFQPLYPAINSGDPVSLTLRSRIGL